MAIIRSFKVIDHVYRKGGALVVAKDGKDFAASLIYKDGSTLIGPYKGVVLNTDKLANDGVSSLLYREKMLMAHKWGCKWIDWGRSRPFLSDGSLRFKLKWGLEVAQEDIGTGAFAIAASKTSELGESFLASHRFFEITSKGISVYPPV